MVPVTPPIAGAVIARKIRKIIKAFYDHFAFDKQTALTKEQLGIYSHFLFRNLISRGVIKESTGGRYYLDEAEAKRYFALRRKRALFTLAFALIMAVFLIVYYNS